MRHATYRSDFITSYVVRCFDVLTSVPGYAKDEWRMGEWEDISIINVLSIKNIYITYTLQLPFYIERQLSFKQTLNLDIEV